MPLTTESTTFARDVLGRYTCSTWEEATSDPAGIDVVVLGGGLYGSYCASKIFTESRSRFGRPLRVLVLEAGPFVLPEHTQNLPDLGFFDPGLTNAVFVGAGANPPIRNEVWGVGWRSNQPYVGQAYCVGGKGIFWGGWCPRLQQADLVDWPTDVVSYLNTPDARRTRPIEHRDLVTNTILQRGAPLTGYEAIEYEIGVLPVDDFLFDPVKLSANAQVNAGLNEALRVYLDTNKASIDSRITQVLPAPVAVQTQSFISGLFALDKYSSVPALIAATRSDHGDGRETDLRAAIVPNCHVVRVGFLPSSEAPSRGTRIIKQIDVVVEGQPRSLNIAPHCQVVLAMSCIESTRLALESFSLVDSGLRAPGDELMGRNFMIHLRCDIAFDIDRAAFANWVQTTWPGRVLSDELQLAAAHIQCSGANGRYQYQLYAATNINGPDANMYRMVPDLDIQREIESQFQADKVRIVLRASGEVAGGRQRPLQDPNFDYIDLAGDGDFDSLFGHRRAWVQFNRGNHAAAPIWQDMHNTAHAIARGLNGGAAPIYREDLRNSTDYTLAALKAQQGVGTTFHDSGTLWMGDDPNTSVTDTTGHFHHVTNAYCCDQAVFPTVGSANPVLTGIALARRVAETIVDRHDKPPNSTLALSQRVSLLSSNGWQNLPYGGSFVLDAAEGGTIAMNPTQGIGFYYLDQVFSNFRLSIEWRANREFQGNTVVANAGILLRMPNPVGVNFGSASEFNRFYATTTEIQIDAAGKRFDSFTSSAVFGSSLHKTGAIYEVAPATSWEEKVSSPPGGHQTRYWNLFEIEAKGTNITVTLNGRRVSSGQVAPPKLLQGRLGLQFHTGSVEFRDLRIFQFP